MKGVFCIESPVLNVTCVSAASDAVRTELQRFLPRAHHAVLAMGATLHLLGSLLAPQHSGEAGPEAQQQDPKEGLAATEDSEYASQVPQQARGAPPSQQSVEVEDSQQGSLQGQGPRLQDFSSGGGSMQSPGQPKQTQPSPAAVHPDVSPCRFLLPQSPGDFAVPESLTELLVWVLQVWSIPAQWNGAA